MWSAAIRGFALTFTTDSNFVIRFKLETWDKSQKDIPVPH